MIPLQGFDFEILQDPEFKEDSVREEIVAPLLRALGYSTSGPNRIVRSRRLEHPYVALGTTRHKISIVPDYLLLVENQPAWVLDAKSPAESIDDPNHHAQVYSYSIHRDVRVDWYAICNGSELALYNVADMTSAPRLRFALQELATRWPEAHSHLWCGGLVASRGLDKDLGILLLRAGLDKGQTLHFPRVPLLHPSIGRSTKERYRLANAVRIEGQRYHVSFDFDECVFASLLALLGSENASGIAQALGRPPAGVSCTGNLGHVNLECRLGEFEENDQEQFIPLRVVSVAR